ncbi:sigma-E factor regulatory protein RseB domain-containing protein [Spirillospora albida]|uniref:sigma-E factor regulatory protein RseB domain-containing protein n=1 Tax=Spirillospora albida TaxID=58123 RepID=UPI0004C294AE|nr:sigma-E factor regulatory protein RseB domain-containing protein [Spirillospora albida]
MTGRDRRRALLACGLAGLLALAGALAGEPAPARRAPSDPGAVGLLRGAADAARRVPYEGRRFLTTWNRGRAVTSHAAVAHTPGGVVRYEGDAGAGAYPDSAATGDTAGFTAATLALLTRNYSVVRAGDTAICGRRARVVEARRADGTPAGRFWIDADTGLMLYRELIDATGRRVVASGFTEIRLGLGAPRVVPALAGGSGRGSGRLDEQVVPNSATTLSMWPDELTGAEVAAMRADGWPVPDELPGRLSRYDARRGARGAVHLSYSDGLAAVSVFVQRGGLDERAMTAAGGWRRTERRGRTVFRRESLGRWAVAAGGGYVYTVVTDAPPSTAVAVAAELSRDRTSFWTRVTRGARRIGSAAGPFD